MINTYEIIEKSFGAPLSVVPLPKVPFKLNGWHLLLGVVLIGCTAYGVYALRRDGLEMLKKKREQ